MKVQIDATEVDTRAVQCHWCGEEGDTLTRYGTLYVGLMHWSPALCGTECHDEMYGTEVRRTER
jgi:hypothetical protein